MIFTEERANKSLVLVEPIVNDLIQKQASIQYLLEIETPTAIQEKEMKRLKREINYHIKELEGIGCILRNRHTGEVSFPLNELKLSNYLSWKPGEPAVSLVQRQENTVVQIRPYTV